MCRRRSRDSGCATRCRRPPAPSRRPECDAGVTQADRRGDPRHPGADDQHVEAVGNRPDRFGRDRGLQRTQLGGEHRAVLLSDLLAHHHREQLDEQLGWRSGSATSPVSRQRRIASNAAARTSCWISASRPPSGVLAESAVARRQIRSPHPAPIPGELHQRGQQHGHIGALQRLPESVVLERAWHPVDGQNNGRRPARPLSVPTTHPLVCRRPVRRSVILVRLDGWERVRMVRWRGRSRRLRQGPQLARG